MLYMRESSASVKAFCNIGCCKSLVPYCGAAIVAKMDGKLDKKSDLASIDFALSFSGTSENGLIDTGFFHVKFYVATA
ncbi:hypothetical protein OTSGILL_1824 [Orientia tsutsugamushi str. Gilliam]|uniref:Uncharacterized protein n=1 Tax=Orientia tsutsugamushi str. Gilliam TaxID=1359184 RepID=A0A0F3M8R2_ORITS|nr:hypothetical protein OTSGILL_1824 [Orientia tsutsugamushi str. Gilliam]SPR03015.1 Uncharacterised protein [Orientia tsutsugamushi str. Gilliam]